MLEVALYIVSGLTLYAGGHHLYLGANRARNQPHLQLGLMYLLLSGFALASALTYQSPALTNLLPAAKVAVGLGLLLWCALIWHIAFRTGFKPWLLLDGLTAAWLVFLIQNAASVNSLIYADVLPVRQTQLNGETLELVHTFISPWWSAVELTMLASLAFCAYAIYRLYRHKRKTTAMVVGAGLALLGLVTLHDHLVSAQLIETSYLAPFGFLGFLAANSLYPVIRGWRDMRKPKQPPMIYNLTFKPDYASFHTDVSELRTPLTPVAENESDTTGETQTPVNHYAVGEHEDIEDVPGETLKTIETPQENEKPAKPAEPPPPAIDQNTLNAVTDNLIDIAVYATMVLNRFKRGDADPVAVENLCKKIRTRAIKTRRMAAQLSRPTSLIVDKQEQT